MSMSLDGFIAGPNESVENGLGDGGQRLHDWVIPNPEVDPDGASVTGANRQIVDEFMATGAIVAGRGTVEPAGYWGGDHHDGVPIFILTRDPDSQPRRFPLVTYVSDVATAMARARRPRATRTSWSTAPEPRSSHWPRRLDELEIHRPSAVRPGPPPFEGLGPEHIELDAPGPAGRWRCTHLHYRVIR
jgi:hypothetical protein